MRVLVVEDDPSTSRAISQAIDSYGYSVEVAADGRSAWRLLQAKRIPIVVTDWLMPGESGIDLVRRIRRSTLPQYTYVMLLTSRRDREHLIEALSAGADDFIAKPFDPEELRARLVVARRIVNLEIRLRKANRKLLQSNKRLRARSRVDPLMGIGSRLAFDEEVAALHDKAKASSAGYGVIMCDIDYFKCYNDTFGHQSGDQILRGVAASIGVGIRLNDAAFRYGGEEIALLLSRLDVDEAAVIAERVRRGVEAVEYRLDEAQVPCRATVSCGVAVWDPHKNAAESWKSVVESADQALYAAKRAGRNRVAVMRDGAPVVESGPSDVEGRLEPAPAVTLTAH